MRQAFSSYWKRPSITYGAEQARATSDGFKSETNQDQDIIDDKTADGASLKISDEGDDAVAAGMENGKDGRNLYQEVIPDNGQHLYYGPSYGYHQSSYLNPPQGHYISNMGSGSPGYGPHFGHFYAQAPSSLLQYYSTEQEVSKTTAKKQNSKDGQNQKVKSVANGRQGYHVAYKNFVSPDVSSQWSIYPEVANGNFYGSSNGYDFYSQQWHSSARGFQPIPPPQNVGIQGNYVPPLPGGGHVRYQNISRLQNAVHNPGKALKGNMTKGQSGVTNWRVKDSTKIPNRIESPANDVLNTDAELSLMKKFKVYPTIQDHDVPTSQSMTNNHSSINRDDYNKESFQISYERAKFFIIKSYSEDDVHKSIKYGVWSSTPNGNKRLDEAYRKAQEQSESFSATCPIFFFFSVNSSGQFCGVAEMIGSVDFGKNMDFWLQGKWNGCLPVRWHIIKDVPNGQFRHIILSNNENKPVTHSRDTQEVHFHQGLEMLKIFKFFPMRTSLLDDFAFYDDRQRVLQERKSRQQQQQQQRQQMVRQFKDRGFGKLNNVSADGLSNDKENGAPVCDEATVERMQFKLAELKVDMEANLSKTEEHSQGEDPENKCESKETGSEPPKIGKEEISRTVINYKKALLGGMSGKVVVLDQITGP